MPKRKKKGFPQRKTSKLPITNYQLQITNLQFLRKRRLLVVFVALVVFVVFIYSLSVLRDLPALARLASPQAFPQSTKILDREGRLLYNIYSSQNRTLIPLSEISDSMKQATIAIEDQDFYRHGPLDPRGIARALTQTLLKRNLQGGSTITQQLVKISVLSPDRTIARKIKELILATAAEVIFSKDKIFELYLSQVSYGGATYGVEAASETYFGKKAKDLTLAESALLAGLPASPTRYSPFGAHPQLARQRQKEVLRRMVEDGYITKGQADEAEKQEFHFSKNLADIKAPHFSLYVKQLLIDQYGEKAIEQGGYKVTTTLDLDIQEYAQATVAGEVAKLKNLLVSNGAALVTKPATGEILAMVGSHDFFDEANDGNVNVTLALRQPGSAIKPINYAAGLGKGIVTAATPFIDKRTCYPNVAGTEYCPVNYDGRFHGIVQLRYALANSYNIPAVKMLKLTGVEDMIATAAAMGITTFKDPSRYGLSLTLGGGEVTMLEMAAAFGVFANSGYRVDLVSILKVEDVHGKVLYEYKPPASPFFAKKAIPESVAFLISHILADNNARSAAFGTSSELFIASKTVSVKTGTTDDKRDNWTIGFTPSYLVTTWVGNNNNTPMHPTLSSGVTGAAPIWNRIMTYLLKDAPNESPKKPDTVIDKTVCADYGSPVDTTNTDGSTPACPTRFEYAIKGFTDPHVKAQRQSVLIDKATGSLAKEGETDNVESKDEVILTDPTGDRFCVTCPLPPEFSLTPTPNPTP